VGLIFWLLVEERKPENAIVHPLHRVPIGSFFKEICRKDMLPLLGLAFVMSSLWNGLGQFESLLVTEQWGYSKAQYGTIMSISVITTLLFLPLGGWLSDKHDRMKLLQAGLFLALGVKLFYYVYAEYIAPNGVPSYHMVILLGLFKGGIGSMMAVACVPLIFDFVDSNRMGTLSAGMGITFGLTGFININAMGVWIRHASPSVYGLPEGTFNYMAGYHWIFAIMILGIAYFFYFARMVKTGRMVRLT
jgi:MFS family permease